MYLGGTVDLQVDAKGRLRIPGKYRPFFNDCETIYMHLSDGCIEILTDKTVNRVYALMGKASTLGGGELSRAFTLFSATTVAIKEDAQGRFTIPSTFKSAINLGKEVRFVGLCDKLQIWDKDTFVKEFEQPGDDYKDSLALLDKFLNEHSDND